MLAIVLPVLTVLTVLPMLALAGADPAGAPAPAAAPAAASALDVTGLVDVGATIPGVHVEMKYSTTDNFMKRDVYGDFAQCLLVDDAAKMLARAHELLKQRAPDLTFALYDCGRPRRVQLIMWDLVKDTPQRGYVANPHVPPGSVHNLGCAVDLSLWNTKQNVEVDMGTPYDFFGRAAEPRHEVELWKAGKLTSEQYANRLLLREVMLRAGFRILVHEWWHFDCAPAGEARKKYRVIP